MSDDDRTRPRTTIAARVAKWVASTREWDEKLPAPKGEMCWLFIAGERGAEELARVDASRPRSPEEIGDETERLLFDLAADAVDTRDGWKASLYLADSNGTRITGANVVRVTAALRDLHDRTALAAPPAAPAVERAGMVVAAGYVDLQRQTRRQLSDANDEIARRDVHHRELMSANVAMASALASALATVTAQSQAAVAQANDRAMKAEAEAARARQGEREAMEIARRTTVDLEDAAKIVEAAASDTRKIKRAETILGNVLAKILERQGVQLSPEDVDAMNSVLGGNGAPPGKA